MQALQGWAGARVECSMLESIIRSIRAAPSSAATSSLSSLRASLLIGGSPASAVSLSRSFAPSIFAAHAGLVGLGLLQISLPVRDDGARARCHHGSRGGPPPLLE